MSIKWFVKRNLYGLCATRTVEDFSRTESQRQGQGPDRQGQRQGLKIGP